MNSLCKINGANQRSSDNGATISIERDAVIFDQFKGWWNGAQSDCG